MKRLFKVTLLAVLAAMCALPSFAQAEKTIKRKVANIMNINYHFITINSSLNNRLL